MTREWRDHAVIELKDMAYEMERRAMQMDGDDFERGKRNDRAKMLREIARILEATWEPLQ